MVNEARDIAKWTEGVCPVCYLKDANVDSGHGKFGFAYTGECPRCKFIAITRSGAEELRFADAKVKRLAQWVTRKFFQGGEGYIYLRTGSERDDANQIYGIDSLETFGPPRDLDRWRLDSLVEMAKFNGESRGFYLNQANQPALWYEDRHQLEWLLVNLKGDGLLRGEDSGKLFLTTKAIDLLKQSYPHGYKSKTAITIKETLTISNPIPIPNENLLVDKIKEDCPDAKGIVFLMMKFNETKLHEDIVAAVRSALAIHGYVALRADDKDYSNDLWHNVEAYMQACTFGVAIFERIISDDFNPNVSLEVGYLLGSGKEVCLLKDKTLSNLNTDLVGKLYKPFDPQSPEKDIAKHLSKWMADRGYI